MDRRKAVACEGVMRFAAAFSKEGSSVFLPLDESGPVDLVVLRDKLLRVQIKSVKPLRGVIHANFRSSNNWSVKHYSLETADLFGVYDHHSQKGYILDLQEFNGKTDISLRLDDSPHKLAARYAEKYRFF